MRSSSQATASAERGRFAGSAATSASMTRASASGVSGASSRSGGAGSLPRSTSSFGPGVPASFAAACAGTRPATHS